GEYHHRFLLRNSCCIAEGIYQHPSPWILGACRVLLPCGNYLYGMLSIGQPLPAEIDKLTYDTRRNKGIHRRHLFSVKVYFRNAAKVIALTDPLYSCTGECEFCISRSSGRIAVILGRYHIFSRPK